MTHTTNKEDQLPNGWEEHKIQKLLRQAAMPFPQKLEWIEEATTIANRLLEQSNKKGKSAKEK